MSFEQTRDLIGRARAFHRQLRDFYHGLETVAEKERVRMLLDYLARHEEIMEKHLAEYEAGPGGRVLDTWLKYAPHTEIRKALAEVGIRPDAGFQDVVCTALRLDELLLEMYRKAAEMAPREDVRELFRGLFEEGKRERAKLVMAVFEVQ